MHNFRFESTQSRGRRIEEAMNHIAWDEMPEDGLVLKEYEPPTIAKEDLVSLSKFNIKNTLREFWELREENYEDESNHLSKKVDEMDIEKIQTPEETESPSNRKMEPQKTFPSDPEPIPSQIGQRHEVRSSQRNEQFQPPQQRTGNQNNFMNSQGMNFTQSSQNNPNYLLKLAKAFDDPKIPKGKLKFSQKFNFPSSSTFIDPRKKYQGFTQMSTVITESGEGEDIEDLEDVDEDGLYVSHAGPKKMKLEVHMEHPPKQQQQQTMYPILEKEQREIEPEMMERELGLLETLEKALRRPTNQPPVKWLVEIINKKIVCGISSVEFRNISPDSKDITSCYAILNSTKQYYSLNVVTHKKYYFINPRLIINQNINSKKMYYVDKFEEVG